MPSSQRQEARRGYTVLELVVTIMIIGILASVAIASTRKTLQSNEEHGAERRLQFILNEARNSGLALASASGTTQVNTIDPSCPPEVNAVAGIPSGQAAVVIDVGATTCANPNPGSPYGLCDVVTWVAYVLRSPGGADPPNFSIACRKVEFSDAESNNVMSGEFVRGLRFDKTRMNVQPSPLGTANRYVITYDSRGFVSNVPGGAAAIKIGTVDRINAKPNGWVVLASGHACRDANPTSMALVQCQGK